MAYSFLIDGEEEVVDITYGELDARARAIATALREVCAPGANVLVVHPPGISFIVGLFACLYAGVTAIPAYPPTARHARLRLRAILEDARPTAMLADSRPDEETVPVTLVTGELYQRPVIDWMPPASVADAPALIQYTSGSTTTPKGVIVTHRNLIYNQGLIAGAFGHDERSVIVSWLPVYHDMGLSNLFQALYVGARCVQMSPIHFLQRPVRWLEAISRHRGTTSGGPNFAYEHCLRRITPEQKQGLDLRSWRVAYNGAEPVRAGTLRQFAEEFALQGFHASSFRPCYGLAEATLMVTCGGLKGSVSVSDCQGSNRELVSCGAAPGDRLAIVGPSGAELPADQVGEIWISGASVAAGYWNRPEETEAFFGARLTGDAEARFLRTGDLGFVSKGELFIAGRLKDLVILRGQNHHPEDIELTIDRSDRSLPVGSAAAFTVDFENEERLAIVQEAPRGPTVDLAALVQTVRRRVLEEHGLQISAVAMIKPGTLPRTTSGKVRRAECRDRFLAGQLTILEEWRETGSSDETSGASILDVLMAWTASRLGVDAGAIDAGQLMVRQHIDSLSAIDLAQAVESRFGVTLPVTSFLGEASLSSIAARIHSEIGAMARRISSPAAEPDNTGALSHGQRSRWLLDQISTSRLGINVVARAARVIGDLDVGALRRALTQLVDRHPMLRTTFSSSAGEPAQTVHPQLAPEFVEYDANDVRFAERLEEEAWRPFSLESGPLVRVHVFRRGGEGAVLLFAAHHIVVDFWSLEILFSEWALLYAKECAGSPASLPPLDFTHAEYVRRQDKLLYAEGERLGRYWESQLAGDLPRVALPHDRLPPSPRTYRGAAIPFALDASLTRRVEALAEAECVTPFVVVFAALDVLLCRYTGQEDVIVGTPTAGRGPEALSGVVGCFINPVAIRTDLSGDPPFRELLARVRASLMGALEHRAYPVEALVERLRPERHLGRSALFDILFVWMQAHQPGGASLVPFALGKVGARLDFGGVTLEAVPLRSRPTLFDLEFLAGKVGAELHGELTYSTDLFDASTAARFVERLHNVLVSILDAPEERISRLALIDKAEESWLSSCREPTGDGADALLHELFAARVAENPAAIAISFQDERITYGDLDGLSNELAHRLRDAGAADRPIAIGLDDGPAQVIAMLAALKTGSPFVCVDVGESADRLERILADVAPSHFISTADSLELSRVGQASAWAELQVRSLVYKDGRTAANVPPKDAAYIVYTSGSGGEPKGIVQSHAGFCQFLRWQMQRFEMGPPQRIAQWAAVTYDAAYCEIFGALCAGSTLCMATTSTRHDPTAFLAWVEREAITLLQVVPSFCRQLLERPSAGADPLRSVEWMLLAGEAFPVELARELLARYPVRPAFFNLYGPSESVLATCYHVASVPDEAYSIPIGRPFAGRQILVLDAHGQLCPQGVIGEIYIRSRTLTTGYLRRPEETARAYLPAPQADDPEDRMYRTGDLGRWLAGGDLEFRGRNDAQVKIRGVRIELGEVESILRAHASLEDCVAIVSGDGHGGQRVVAYLVAPAPVSIASLRKAASAALPAQAVPAAFVQLETLPRTRTGKIDRRSLPPPTEADLGVQPPTALTWSATEEIVASVWCDLLGLAAVGEQSFFELGGHSLTAVQAQNRLRELTGVALPLVSLFESPTVAGIAACIDAQNRAAENEVERIVQEIEDLSDDEVGSLLRAGQSHQTSCSPKMVAR